MKRVIVLIVIMAGVLLLSAKVIYQFEPEKPHLLKPKTMKSKSAEFFQTHKENYMRYLDEKTDLNYVTTQKVDTKGDTLRYFWDILYSDRINLKKLNELRKLGLTNYTDEEVKKIEIAEKNQIALHTLAYKILSNNTIFIGTVQSIEPFSHPNSFLQTKVTVKTNEILRGAYYYDPLPENFTIYCHYNQKVMTREYQKINETQGEDKFLEIGHKYIIFVNKSIGSGAPFDDLNNMNVFENHRSRIYSIENNNIQDKHWSNKYKNYIEVTKLKEYIKQIEKTNETENFFNIDFK